MLKQSKVVPNLRIIQLGVLSRSPKDGEWMIRIYDVPYGTVAKGETNKRSKISKTLHEKDMKDTDRV